MGCLLIHWLINDCWLPFREPLLGRWDLPGKVPRKAFPEKSSVASPRLSKRVPSKVRGKGSRRSHLPGKRSKKNTQKGNQQSLINQ